jgi:hypothetical protein
MGKSDGIQLRIGAKRNPIVFASATGLKSI